MLAIRYSSLRGTEASICCLNNLCRGVCCLPRPCICDITNRLLSLVWPEKDHIPTLSHRVKWGSNKETLKYQNMSLGKMLKDTSLSSQLETENLEKGDEWIKRMAGALLKVLGSMISDAPLRDEACWHQMGNTQPGGARAFWAARSSSEWCGNLETPPGNTNT